MLEELVAEGWPRLRGHLASDLGTLARFTIALPEVPIESISLRSEAPEGRLVIGVMTGLPVRGAPTPTFGGSQLESQSFELFIPGVSLAEIGNWAMETGRMPSRYDSRGRPSDDGPFEVGLGWQDGSRPLVAHLWRSGRPCVRALVTAQPEVRVDAAELTFEAREARIEEFHGSLVARLAAASSRLWRRALDLSSSMGNETGFAVGDQPFEATVTSVRRTEEGFRAVVGLRPAESRITGQ
jgi:hypothetical protein